MEAIRNDQPLQEERPIQHYEFPYMRKPKEKQSVWRGIYNRDKNYILGRTPSNWGSLFIFYAVFYAVLASLFAICMQGLLATLSEVEPKWKLDSSRIGTNPGLGFRPISEDPARGSLIWYDSKKPEDVKYWNNLLEEFLQPYGNKSNLIHGGKNQIHCDFDHRPVGDQTCLVDTSNWKECSVENRFGYARSAPCIILKLNRIFDWIPEYYDDADSLPADMPQQLKDHIRVLPPKERKQIWVTCNGENTSDKEIIGPIKYFHYGFPEYFYPFTNSPGYLSPLVVVQFERPTLHRIINIECRAWAKNIIYNGSFRDRQGSVHLELMIDAE